MQLTVTTGQTTVCDAAQQSIISEAMAATSCPTQKQHTTTTHTNKKTNKLLCRLGLCWTKIKESCCIKSVALTHLFGCLVNRLTLLKPPRRKKETRNVIADNEANTTDQSVDEDSAFVSATTQRRPCS